MVSYDLGNYNSCFSVEAPTPVKENNNEEKESQGTKTCSNQHPKSNTLPYIEIKSNNAQDGRIQLPEILCSNQPFLNEQRSPSGNNNLPSLKNNNNKLLLFLYV